MSSIHNEAQFTPQGQYVSSQNPPQTTYARNQMRCSQRQHVAVQEVLRSMLCCNPPSLLREHTLRGCNHALAARIDLCRLPQRTRKGLEGGLHDVVAVVARQLADVQCDTAYSADTAN